MSYHCPACRKVSVTSSDLARHVMGRGDRVHRDWLSSKGLKFSDLLAAQMKSFGGEGYATLSGLLERETKGRWAPSRERMEPPGV